MPRTPLLDLRHPIFVLLAGSVAAFAIFIGGPLVFLNPPQCPYGLTQAEIDTSRCIIGANIGLPLLLVAGFVAWMISTAGLTLLVLTELRQR